MRARKRTYVEVIGIRKGASGRAYVEVIFGEEEEQPNVAGLWVEVHLLEVDNVLVPQLSQNLQNCTIKTRGRALAMRGMKDSYDMRAE